MRARVFVFVAATLLVAGVVGLGLREHRMAESKQTSGQAAHEPEGRRPNRLIREKSPYLLQHAYNPVDWYPWGAEAFDRAKREDKPVFLSIGYSTCYWCHVMEQESFENPEVATLMNQHFVSIKVDREERPDLDAVYMTAIQAMSGQGGWPMTVFLTPQGQPFWGGTYFPPDDRAGRPGLRRILTSIAEAWRSRRDDILRSGQSITEAIQAGAVGGGETTAAPTLDVFRAAAAQLGDQYDAAHGGFGPAPKFPRSHALSFLLHVWARGKEPRMLDMVTTTLDAMDRGGLHDQLGGGFHRYSTDERWLVPHFEKMLYDQALLARTYLEAYQATGRSRYADVARDIFEYVLRDLRDPGGAFYSAEDAGEVGKEGEFYVWTPAEIEHVLGEQDAEVVDAFYGVTRGGNFEHGRSILSVPQPLEAFAAERHLSVEEVRERLEASRRTLFETRNRRRRPHRDDKILTDWNGLMIGALAYGGRVLHEPRYVQAADEAATFLMERLRRDGHLLHRYRDGHADIDAFLDDDAFLSWGLLELYETTFDARWLQEAKRLTEEMVRLFWDQQSGGFFFSGTQNEQLIAKTKELYDGALPSGNSVAALDLMRVGLLTMDEGVRQIAEQLFKTFSARLTQAPHAYPQFLIALDWWLGPAQEIVIAGDPDRDDAQRMIREVARRFLPRAVVILHPTGPSAGAIEELVPFVREQTMLDGNATAYVCEQYRCQLPTTDLTQFTSRLDSLH